MDGRSIGNILELLRSISRMDDKLAARDVLKEWFGPDDAATCYAAAQIIEQAQLAAAVIANSQLEPEAKSGLIQVLKGVQNAFSLHGLNSAWPSNLGNVVTSISMLGMLVSFTGGQTAPASKPKELQELVDEIADVMFAFDSSEIDPIVKNVCRRHLQILSTLLQHVPIFGVEAAMASYFELLMKIRRAEVGESAGSAKATAPLWEKIKTWGERLGSIDKIVNAGAKLLEKGEKVAGLLEHLD